jgi:hypothetical protein
MLAIGRIVLMAFSASYMILHIESTIGLQHEGGITQNKSIQTTGRNHDLSKYKYDQWSVTMGAIIGLMTT